MQGKLVEQDESDGTADELIDQILEEKEKLMSEGKIKKEKLSRIYKNPTDNHYYEKFDDGKIIDISNIIPFEIPKIWKWTRLNTILSVKGGKRIPKGYSFSKNVTDHIYIRISDMKNNTIVKQDIKYISDDVFEKIKNYTISKNDLYLTIAGTIGKVGVVPDFFNNMNLTENAVKLTNISFIDKKYLMYCINSDFIQEQFTDKITQVAQPKLAIKRIETTIIPVPPLQEQGKIVKEIENLISKINQIEKSFCIINANKKILKAKIADLAIKGKLTKQLSTDEPSSKLIESIIEEKHKLMKDGKIKKENLSVIYKDTDNQFYEKFDDGKIINITKEIPYSIPQNWAWTRLKTICTKIVDGDHNPPPAQPHKTDFIMLSAKNIQNDKLVNLEDARYLNKTDYELGKKRINLQKEDILLTIVGTLGRSCIYDDNKNILFQRSVAVLTTLINNYFLKLILDSNYIQNKMNHEAKGTAQRGFYLKQLERILIPVAPLEEQGRIINKKNNIFNYIKTAE